MCKQVRYMGYYVPNSGMVLISIHQQVKYKGFYFHTENNKFVLVFPTFIFTANIEDKITPPISFSKKFIICH